MTIIDVGRARRVRLRSGAPDLRFCCASPRALSTEVETNVPSSSVGATSLFVEYYRAVGARAHFCALGARFEPKRSGGLLVRVVYCENDTRTVADTISTTQVPVFSGIPEEAASFVLVAAKQEAARLLPAGLLEFWGGAYNHVDSSPALFALAAESLVLLLSLPGEQLTKERIVQQFGIRPSENGSDST